MRSLFDTQIGRRENNEDFVAQGAGIYVVCDGVGGLLKGEVASRFVAENLVKSVEEFPIAPFNKTSVQQRIVEVQQGLNRRLVLHPDEEKMGTTLAAVFHAQNRLLLAHIGDSRIYYVRTGKGLYWRTTDHSTVAQLVKAGIIDESGARAHPRRNEITRAIQANVGGETVHADISEVKEVEAGDLILICSDGVTEAMDDDQIITLLCRKDITLEEKLAQIEETCRELSRDNNTALILEIGEEDVLTSEVEDEMKWQEYPGIPPGPTVEVTWEEAVNHEAESLSSGELSESENSLYETLRSFKTSIWVIIFFLIFVVVSLVINKKLHWLF